MDNDRTSFGKYRVLARLGSGGMGLVFLAVAMGPAGVQKLVVVKQLRDTLSTSAAIRGMFLDEARVAMRLNHPNVVQTNDVVEDGADLYLVMEFLDGQPLTHLLDPSFADQVPIGARLRILCDALAGLHYAHELSDLDGTPLGIVHRDVSPQNIMITYEGQVKIVDFGIAKAADATTVTDSGVFKGKVRYTSPEQALCLPIDRRADVFGMGIILWECIVGRRMWTEANDASILIAIVSGKIPDVRDVKKDAATELAAIVVKALAVDPKARFATANEMRNALLGYLKTLNDTTEIGHVLSAGFAKERADLRALVDAQIKAVRERSVEAHTLRKIPIFTVEPNVADGTAIARGGLAVEASPFKPVRSTTTIAVAVAGVVAVIAGVTFLSTRSSDEGAANAAGVASSSAPAASVPAVPETVHLRLHATPDSARFVLDGTTMATNPYEADVRRDGSNHTLSIRADGFAPRTLDTAFDRDVSIDVALSPVAPPPQQQQSKPIARPKGDTLTPPAPRPTREIDEGDPYRP